MTCPLCSHAHKATIQEALDKAVSYEALATRHRLHLADIDLHVRHRRRTSPLAEPAFRKASRQAQLAMIADHARHQLDVAFLDRRPATIRAAARFYFECSAQLNRWIEKNGDDTPRDTADRDRDLDIEASIALLNAHEDLVPEWIRLRDALDEQDGSPRSPAS